MGSRPPTSAIGRFRVGDDGHDGAYDEVVVRLGESCWRRVARLEVFSFPESRATVRFVLDEGMLVSLAAKIAFSEAKLAFFEAKLVFSEARLAFFACRSASAWSCEESPGSSRRETAMNPYETLTGRLIDISALTPRQRRVMAVLHETLDVEPSWDTFSNFWQAAVRPVIGRLSPAARTKHPLYAIGQDMELRLGIKQKKVAPPDYRDYIVARIEERFGSRYKFCQETGVPQAFLSQVLSGQKDFSLEMLRKVADALGLGFALLPIAELAEATPTRSRGSRACSRSPRADRPGRRVGLARPSRRQVVAVSGVTRAG